jgi:hypothetical protein
MAGALMAKNKCHRKKWQMGSVIPVESPESELHIYATATDTNNTPVSCLPECIYPAKKWEIKASSGNKPITVYSSIRSDGWAYGFNNVSKIKQADGGPLIKPQKQGGKASLEISLSPKCVFEMTKSSVAKYDVKWVEGYSNYKVSLRMKSSKPVKVTAGLEEKRSSARNLKFQETGKTTNLT